jgi:antitoxin MazE
LAVIVPESLAAQAGLRDGAPAELEVTEGRLVVRSHQYNSLAEVLAAITPENMHPECDSGPPVGAELL